MQSWLLFFGLIGGSCGAAALGWLFTAAARIMAPRIGFVDRPGGHKSHQRVMPYGGGTAIFLAGWLPLGLLLAAAALIPQDFVRDTLGEPARVYFGGAAQRAAQGFWLLLGSAAIHVLGVIDDRKPLGPGAKLPVILAVALFTTTIADVRLLEMAHPAVALTLTTLWLAVLMNAFNFLDNMDGLSAGVAAICLLFFAICGVMAGQVLVPALACVFLGAISGFLWFNFPPARIFMGDGGSLLIGYWTGVVSVLTTYYPSGAGLPAYALAMPLVILAIPLYDFVSVIAIRLAEGRNPLRGDQRHFSHRLVLRGLSRKFAVLTIYLATATTGLAATLLPGADLRRTLTLAGVVALVLAIVAILDLAGEEKRNGS